MQEPETKLIPPATSRKKWIIDNIISLGSALLIVFMIRSSIVEAFKIPSGSMIPTLFVGDHIFVNKFAYGLKIPFSDLVTDHPIYLIERAPPQRGDIVVFLYPKDESLYYIKRVIGVPGDIVELRNKTLFINHKQIHRTLSDPAQSEKIFDSLDDPKYTAESLDLYSEQLDQAEHLLFQVKRESMAETFGPITVPKDSLFVMGDNRDYSNDSRFWGFVPFKNVKGKAMFIWLSFWFNFSESQYTFKPGRIGTLLR